MAFRRTWIRRTAFYTLAYFWAAAAALGISHFLNWQYDGGLGWWAVVAFTFPAEVIESFLAAPINAGARGGFCVSILVVATVAGLLGLLRGSKPTNGS
jgi:hypothetical protein